MYFYPDFILILSRFYPGFLQTHFIQIYLDLDKVIFPTLSKFYPEFILILSRFF